MVENEVWLHSSLLLQYFVDSFIVLENISFCQFVVMYFLVSLTLFCPLVVVAVTSDPWCDVICR